MPAFCTVLQSLYQLQQPLSVRTPGPVCQSLQNPFHFLLRVGLRVPESQHLRHRFRDHRAEALPGGLEVMLQQHRCCPMARYPLHKFK